MTAAVVAPARRLILGLALLFVLAGAEPASAGTPILVVTSPSNPYSAYVPDIMRAEGLNGFTTADVSAVNPATLAAYEVVVLGPVSLTPDQVTALGGWVVAGGNLVALSPDPQLAGLLGLAPTGATAANGYLAVDTSKPPGAGIVGGTIQYHGTADLYALNGAAPVAMLYSSATAATNNPAVTMRGVGTAGGEAAAFTFDLARSVIYTRQGNPAYAGLNRDALAPIRTNDLFYPDWVDVNRMLIPQADELQRLFANLITYLNRDRTPVPRFWYLPRGERAAVIMTGDDHDELGTAGRFDQYIAASPPGCVVANWECVRSTSYVYQGTVALPTARAESYVKQGFEVALHPGDGGCITSAIPRTELEEIYDEDLAGWDSTYGTVLGRPVTSRFHCVAWIDWSSHAEIEAERGIRLDTNYYHFPEEWGQRYPGFMTGSGLIMRFADENGAPLPIYQANTHITDEWALRSNATFTSNAIQALLSRATGAEGFYGLFTANMHTDDVASPGSDAIVAAAKQYDVPVISARQALEWVEGRDGSSFTDFTWANGRLGFTVNAAAGARGLQGMVPMQSALGRLQGLSHNGVEVSVKAETVKGVDYGVFSAASGRYEARYPFSLPTPSRSGPRGPVVRGTDDGVAPRVRLELPRKIRLRKLLRKGLAYRLTCSEACSVRVRLTMKVGKRKAVAVASKRRKLGGARGARMVVKPGRKAAKKLRRVRPKRLTLRIRVVDAFGNARVVKRRVRLLS